MNCLVPFFLLILMGLLAAPLGYAGPKESIKSVSFGSNCAVIVPIPVRKISYNGGCINGLAEGWGEVEMFTGTFGRMVHQGYFHQGYAIDQWYRDGTFIQTPQGQTYFYTAQDFGDLFFPVQGQNITWNLCSGRMALSPNPLIPDAHRRARAYYRTICTAHDFITVETLGHKYKTPLAAQQSVMNWLRAPDK